VKPYVDVAIIAPLDEEFSNILEFFEFAEDVSTRGEVRFRVAIPNSDLRILLIKQDVPGRTAAQHALDLVANEYEIGMAICLGIAGALSGDLKIGDVCYSKSIVDVLDNAKISQSVDDHTEFSFAPTYYFSPIEIITSINRYKFNPAFKRFYESWQEICGNESLSLIPNKFTGRNGKEETICPPNAIEGLIACGDVCASSKYRQKLVALHRKVLAIETESGGLFASAKTRNIHAITVRGISDYADIDKNLFEQQTNGMARKVAIRNAAAFLRDQLNSDLLKHWFWQAREKYNNETGQNALFGQEQEDLVGKIVV